MLRLYIICEGQTEEEFVNNLLIDHFSDSQYPSDSYCHRGTRA